MYIYGTSSNAAFLNGMQPWDLFWVKMHALDRHCMGERHLSMSSNCILYCTVYLWNFSECSIPVQDAALGSVLGKNAPCIGQKCTVCWTDSKVPITTLGILYVYGNSSNAAFLNRMQPWDLF
jgi:hypothetical protein